MMLNGREGWCLESIQKSTALRSLRLVLPGAIAVSFSSLAHANPQGGQVAAGQASISSSGNTLSINQNTDKAVIDWRSFNIAADELTAFHQPSSSSMTLNRINDSNPSQILGTLTANGHVILVNPNGVFFGPNSKVDVSGLIASTADIKNDDFLAGNLHFSQPGNANAAIINQGAITAQEAGLVGFVAPFVENDGIIQAKLGKVTLASGDSFTLDMAGDHLIEVAVTGDLAHQLASNTGKIAADGGTVMLTAAAGRQLVDGIVSNSGAIEANSIGGTNGHIVLYAEGSNAVAGNDAALKGQKSGSSTVLVSGTIDASGYGTGQKGGTVQVLSDQVGILSGALIDASGDAGGGTVQIGGDFHGAGTTPAAWATVMQTGATIKADAITDGNGGNVTLWADNYTNFAGNISARGGSLSGDGGSVETSGKQILDMSGLVDASALHGAAGTWLMDPEDVNITTSDNDIAGNPNFVPGGTQATASLNASDIDTALNAGTNVSVTTGGDAQAGPNGGSITVSSPISATTGSGGVTGDLTLSAYSNIVVNSPITLGGAGVTGGNLILDADNHNNGSGYINIANNITTNGGNITLGGGEANPSNIVAGTGYATGNAGQKYGIFVNNEAVNAAGGNIIANGKGYNGTADNNFGIWITGAGAALETTGSGAITLSGIGQGTGTSGYNNGVEIDAGGVVSTANGDLSITAQGAGGASADSNSFGLTITTVGSTIETTGSGNISVTGTGGDTSSNENIGIYVQNANGIQATGSGSITLNGTGSGSGSSGINVGVLDIGSVTANGGDISITGTGGGGAGTNNNGVWVHFGAVTDTGAGTIILNGTGGGSGASGAASGIEVDGGGVISTVNGNLTIANASGGSGSGIANYGVYVTDTGSTIETTGSGNLTVTGTGGSGGSGSGSYGDVGIYVTAANGIETTGSGAMTITGTGGDAGGSGFTNHGINLGGGASITGNGGAMTISGTGGNSSGVENYGISLYDGTISNNGNGSLTISGTGAGNGSSIIDAGITDNGGVISTVNGNLSVTGTGGNSGGVEDFGIWVTGAGTAIKTTGNGNLNVTGTGGGGSVSSNDDGVHVNSGGAISTVNGNLTVTGTGGGGAASSGVFIASSGSTIETTGTGNLTVTGTGGDAGGSGNYGVDIASANGLETTSAGSITAVATSSDFFLDTAGSILGNAAGTAITVASGENFLNDAGAAALAAPNGRWLVYSMTPTTDVIGGLNGTFIRFSCSYGGSCPSVPLTGNGLLYSSMLPDSVSKAFSDAAYALQASPMSLPPAGPVDYAYLIAMTPPLVADVTSPFLFDAGE